MEGTELIKRMRSMTGLGTIAVKARERYARELLEEMADDTTGQQLLKRMREIYGVAISSVAASKMVRKYKPQKSTPERTDEHGQLLKAAAAHTRQLEDLHIAVNTVTQTLRDMCVSLGITVPVVQSTPEETSHAD
jgi:hypothetical protein